MGNMDITQGNVDLGNAGTNPYAAPAMDVSNLDTTLAPSFSPANDPSSMFYSDPFSVDMSTTPQFNPQALMSAASTLANTPERVTPGTPYSPMPQGLLDFYSRQANSNSLFQPIQSQMGLNQMPRFNLRS
jgi:hypothetical protein